MGATTDGSLSTRRELRELERRPALRIGRSTLHAKLVEDHLRVDGSTGFDVSEGIEEDGVECHTLLLGQLVVFDGDKLDLGTLG